MSRTTRERSSAIAWDGKALTFVPIPRTVNAAAVVYFGGFVLPFAGTIVGLDINITTQFTHASSALAFGKMSDLDSHLDDFVLQNLAVGARSLIGDALLLSKAIVAGEAYTFSTAAADTTGVLMGGLWIEPN